MICGRYEDALIDYKKRTKHLRGGHGVHLRELE